MEGINILNQIEYVDLSGYINWIIVLIIIGIAGALIFSHGLITIETWPLLLGPILMIICICGIVYIYEFPHVKKYEYECTIDENANVKDVYDNYIVVERRGDIWVLREK